jgi:aldose 1-epimerase
MNFTIQNKVENGFDKIILKDESSETFAEVIPSSGAILHSFAVTCRGNTLNVIDSYKSAEDFKNNVTKGFLGCKLSPFVCRLNKGKYHFAEKDYQVQKFYLDSHALHGLIYDKAFTVIDQNSSEEKASVTMQYLYRAPDAGYPFNYDCVVIYELEKDNKLNVITKIINKDKKLIPIQDGWHPYFKLEAKVDDLQLKFQSKEMVEFNNELIPTGTLIRYKEFNSLRYVGNTSLDNCFALNFSESQPMCVLKNPEKKIEVEINPEISYPYLQIYIPPHRNSISLENLSSVPDAFNNGMGLRTLSPGESAFFKTSYKITLLN